MSTNATGKTGHPNSGRHLGPFVETDSRWLKGLHVRGKTQGSPCDTDLDNDSLVVTPMSEATKGKSGKVDFIKVKSSCIEESCQ
jgi:hypothetical protein